MFEGCVLTQDTRYKSSTSKFYSRTHLLKQLDEVDKPVKATIITWLVDRHSSRILLRDCSGYREFRVVGRLAKHVLKLPRETLVAIKGVFNKDLVIIEDLDVIHGPVRERDIDYSNVDKYSIEEIAFYSPWILRSPLLMKVVKLQQYILWYAREFLYKKGFTELLPPIASVVSDPGLRGARKLKTKLYGMEYELTSSVIMYKQSSVAVFEKIFFVARNIREEPAENIRTGRHLVEFTQLDIEYALATIDDVMALAEELLKYVTEKLAREHDELVYSINKEFTVFKPPFPRIRYDEALEIVKKLGYSVEWGRELSHEAETALAEYYGSPVWITNFPVVSRGFYYLPDEEDPKYNRDFNLILPHGYGEVIDGGEREYRYSELVERIKAIGESLEKYSWFLDLVLKGGIPPSAGWGLGVERLTRYVAGLKHIALATAFPKLPGIAGTP